MNLLELHYHILKEFDQEKADQIVDKLKSIIIEFDMLDIKSASQFRIKHMKNKFSFIGCLSYSMAKNRNLMFITGDREFKNLENVEFVK